MPSILFVCSANICRSPMAEGLFGALVKDEPLKWQIGSAGVYAEPGLPAAPNTLQVLRKRGIDLPNHRSKPVSADLLAQYSLILTMEKGQKEALQVAFPTCASKIWLVSEIPPLSWR
jgi:protein-tyrosine-phosphatase